MSSPINKNEFIQGDLGLKELRNGFKQTLDMLQQFDDKLKKTSNTLRNEYASAEKLTVENLEKRNKIEQQSKRIFEEKKRNTKNMHAVQKEMLSLDKKLEKAEAQKIAAYSKENKELLKLRAEKNKVNKTIRDEIKLADRATNAYSKLADETTKLKNDSKRLGAELLALEKAGKRNSRQWNETNKRYKQVTRQAQTADAQLKKLDATVGDSQRKVGAYTTATRGLSRALGALGIAAGVGAIFRSVGGTIANYNQAVTDLAAISGKTAEELKPLNDQARQLGATTQFSASEVTGLQIELAKLGFTTQEITDSTGGIANFAAATGVEIPRAAALAGSALRAFNLDATEIDRVVSTLGVATTKTALDFSKLENGLSTVAPVAASFGFSIEDTTALLGQLSNAGFDASSSATATRNILLNLADANGSLAKELGRPVKNAEDLAAGLQELQSRGIDLAEALELTDKRSVAAFSTFIQGSDSLVELRDSITDVNDELTDMADKRLQSVGGAVKLLESAWEGFVLDLNESIGASDAFNTVIRFVADNLTTIISTLGKLAALFLIIKARQKVISSGMLDYTRNLFKAKTAQEGLNTSMKEGSGNASKFGRSLKGIGWAALIGVAIELAVAFYDIASGAAEARRKAEELDNYTADAQAKSTESVQKYNEEYQKRIFNIKEEERVLLSKAKTQQESDRIQADALAKINKEAEKQAKLFATLDKQAQDKIDADRKRLEQLEKINTVNGEIVAGELSAKQTVKILKEAGIEGAKYDSTWRSINVTNQEVIELRSKLNAQIEAAIVRQENYKEALDESDKILKETTNDIIVDNNERDNNRDKINAQVKGLKDQNKELKRQRLNLQDIDALLRKGRYSDPEMLRSQSEIEEEELAQENERIQRALTERLTAINDAERLGTISTEDAADQRLIAELDALNERKRILQFYGKDVVDIDKDISEKQLELSNRTNEQIKKNLEDKKKNQQDYFKTIVEGVKLANDILQEEYDRRIKMEEELANASVREQDRIAAAAAQGTDKAQESLKAQIAAEREALAEQDRLRRRKERAQFITTALQNVQNQLAEGKPISEAVASTVGLKAALTALFAGFDGFYKGTESAPGGFAWVHEKGGEMITDKAGRLKEIGNNKGPQLRYLDKGDKVFTHEKTKQILASNNHLEGAASVAQRAQNTSLGNADVIREMRRNNELMSRLPQSFLTAEKVGSAIKLVTMDKRAGRIRRNTQKIR